jgi:transcriptional regulator with XRE-family HTH domain
MGPASFDIPVRVEKGDITKENPQAAVLGTQIRSRRQELGLTQSRLAGMTDLSRADINALEAGASDLGVARVSKIAQVLDMSLHITRTKHVTPSKRWLKAAVVSGSISCRIPLPEPGQQARAVSAKLARAHRADRPRRAAFL